MLSSLKPHIRRLLVRLLASYDYQVTRKPAFLASHPESEFIPEMATIGPWMASLVENPTFVVVGANDGCTADQFTPLLERFSFRGLFIEPQREVFEILKKRFESPQFYFENVAIGPSEGTLDLYKLNPKYYGIYQHPHYSGIASFSKANLEKAIKGGSSIADLTVTEKVEVKRLDTLLSKYDLSPITILQIDTEGFDYEVLKLVDFVGNAPVLICYEHRHLSPADFESSLALLGGHSYQIYVGREDVTAVRKLAVIDRKR